MNHNKLAILAIIAILPGVLSGCAAGGAYHWESMDGTHNQVAFEQARAACRYDIDRLDYASTPAAPEGGVGGALKGLGDVMGHIGSGMDLFNECMQAKGFRLVAAAQTPGYSIPLPKKGSPEQIADSKCMKETATDITGEEFGKCVKRYLKNHTNDPKWKPPAAYSRHTDQAAVDHCNHQVSASAPYSAYHKCIARFSKKK